jgi:Arc/MetJ-type ribon-helix-helix transcriptional regulator
MDPHNGGVAMVRMTVTVERKIYRKLRALTEDRRTTGRASVSDIVRQAIRLLLARHNAPARMP